MESYFHDCNVFAGKLIDDVVCREIYLWTLSASDDSGMRGASPSGAFDDQSALPEVSHFYD
jgi:hypothetical protein